jgi:hypothetical protein
MTIALRILCLVLGSALVAASCLLYEDEEGRIQNRLEVLWINLSEAQSRALSKQAKFTQAIAVLTDRVFDAIFGEKLVSRRSIAISACFSLGSLGIVCLRGRREFPDIAEALYVPVVLLLLIAGILPSVLGSKLPRNLWLVCVTLLCMTAFIGMHEVGWFDFGFDSATAAMSELGYDAAFLVFTIVCDAAFIIVTRWLLRKVSVLQSAWRISGAALGILTLAVALTLVPYVVAVGPSGFVNTWKAEDWTGSVIVQGMMTGPRNVVLMMLAGSNVLDAVVASVFLGLFLALLIHLLLWPSLQRPIYALATRSIIPRRRLFFVIGAALLSFGVSPSSAFSVGRIMKKLFESFSGP